MKTRLHPYSIALFISLGAIIVFLFSNSSSRSTFSEQSLRETTTNRDIADAAVMTATSTPDKVAVSPGKNLQDARPSEASSSITAAPQATSSIKESPIIQIIQDPILKTYSVEEVYKEWKPYIANVNCALIKDGKEYRGSGTGLLIDHHKDGPSILMARHGFQDWTVGEWGSLSEYCDVTFPDSGLSFTIKKGAMKIDTGDIDLGHLPISDLSQSIKKLLSSLPSLKNCSDIQYDTLAIIIGFPNDTPTNKASYITGKIDGLMDGYKGGEYVAIKATSKSGYSGGVTLSLKDNCYIGIYTFTPGDEPSVSMSLHISLDGTLKYNE